MACTFIQCPNCYACFTVEGAFAVGPFDIDAIAISRGHVKYCPLCGVELETEKKGAEA